jgi:hypothetical protein
MYVCMCIYIYIYFIVVDWFFCEVRNEVEEIAVDLNRNAALSIVSLAAFLLSINYFAGYELRVMINCRYVLKTLWKRSVCCTRWGK